MPSVVEVAIHASQFPEAIRRELLHSLRTRQINHKFHYDTIKQSSQWLALHQAFSPSRTDEDCSRAYDAAFTATVGRITARAVHLVGLGCGGGRKDARLLALLQQARKRIAYTPSDVSTPMVLVASEAAREVLPSLSCHPLVCDLASAEDLPAVLDGYIKPADARLITFFGMIPNFEPQFILPRLAALLRPGDHLLFSANLAPGAGYDAGMWRILPQYDNNLTREWLITFLLDLGVERADGGLRFEIEADPGGSALKRIAAYFSFLRERRIEVDGEKFEFQPGDKVRLFFSYRHTPDRVAGLLSQHGITVLGRWITRSEEEGVFLCSRG
jgi:L-histidine N-alpha-methyltransferase